MRRVVLAAIPLLVLACDAGFTDVRTSPIPEPLATADRGAQQEVPIVPGQVIALFEPGARGQEIARAAGAEPVRPVAFGMTLLQVAEGTEHAVSEALSRNPNVRFAEPNHIYVLDVPCEIDGGSCVLPDNPFMPLKWDQHNDGMVNAENGDPLVATGQADADIDWLEAFNHLGEFTGSARIGMLDSGINSQSPLFPEERIPLKQNFHYDFYFELSPDPGAWEDVDGHGSHTSGIAAGRAPDGVAMRGVAYGPNVEILVARVCGPLLLGLLNGCTEEAVINAIQWAMANGANVLNLSLGGPTPSQGQQVALQQARAAGVLPVCAAGNDQGPVNYPAAFASCLAVSSTDWGDDLASYSSNGPEVELSAPGGDTEDPNAYSRILSAWSGSSTSYALAAGTSMAAPQVAGLATLLHALGVTGVEEKVALMKQTADDLGANGNDPLFGVGRINVYQAVLAAGGDPGNQSPTASFDYDCTVTVCDFTDLSSDPDGDVVGWDWDFGDGNGSTDPSPQHDFVNGADYTVTLTVTDDMGAMGSTSMTISVEGPPPPNEAPSASFTVSCSDLTCTFTDTSSDNDGNVVGWSWNFGDGNTSTAQNPQHTYASAGQRTVTLVATDDDDATDTATGTANPTDPPSNQPPIASFLNTICSLGLCQFISTSSDPDGSIASTTWDFGDGATGSGEAVTHVYDRTDTYEVSITVEDDQGASTTSTQSISVVVPDFHYDLSATARPRKGDVSLNWKPKREVVHVYRFLESELPDVFLAFPPPPHAESISGGRYFDSEELASGVYLYFICRTDGQLCSNFQQVTFP